MKIMSFSRYMELQMQAIRVSGVNPMTWIEHHAFRFRRRVERHFIIR